MSTISNERESVVPVYQMRLIDGTDDQTIWVEVSNQEFNTPLKNPDEWQKRILYPNQPASAVSANAAIAIRACLDEFPESVHDIVEECAAIAENAWRASILQSAMQTCDKCGLTGIHACMGRIETDTTTQQLESLAGKAVGGWIPCSERMPEVGEIVLTADNGCVNVGEMERSGSNYRYFTSVVSGRELPATHWQPLPEPPCK
ncbi:DUF551 domain-containing protein [Cronobacter dublinensis]